MKEHLMVVSQPFQGDFRHGEVSVLQLWMHNPFTFKLDSLDDNDNMQEDIIEMKSSNKIIKEFESTQMNYFLECANLRRFLKWKNNAIEILGPFATTINVKLVSQL